MALLTVLSVAAKILPVVIELVKVAESQIDLTGSGASKKELVLGIVNAGAAEVGEEMGLTPETLQSVIDRVIDVVVSIFNKIGLFKKN